MAIDYLSLYQDKQKGFLQFCKKIRILDDATLEEIPFTPNSSQLRHIHEWKPRSIILKARQIGFTTLKQIELMFWAKHLPGATFGIVLQDDKKTKSKIDDIKNKIDQFGKELGISIDKKHSSSDNFRILNKEGKMVTHYAEVVAGSGAAINTFRAYTLHFCHLSEIGFWQHPEQILKGIMPTLRIAQGMLQIESTPNGMNLFRDLYISNKGKVWQKQTDIVSLFYPWNLHKEFSLPIPKDWQPCDNDLEYMARYGISLGQAYWRREEGLQGSENPTKKQLLDFAQEYPIDDEECWEETQENSPFKTEVLREMKLVTPISIENLNVRIYQNPMAKNFFMGVDVAEGLAKGDDNAFTIVDDNGDIAVLYNSNALGYQDYGALVYQYAIRYFADVTIEINSQFGTVIADYLEEAGYPKAKITRFRTDKENRPRVIYALDKWIVTHTEIKDDLLRKQLITFTKDQAVQKKNKDDLVLSSGLAILAQQTKTEVRPLTIISRKAGQNTSVFNSNKRKTF